MDYEQKTTGLAQKVGKLIASLLCIAAAVIMILLGNHYIKIENSPVAKGYIQKVEKHKGPGTKFHKTYYVADVELEVDGKLIPLMSRSVIASIIRSSLLVTTYSIIIRMILENIT